MTVYSERFQGRPAVVTGAASGIGREVARRLTAESARVSMWDLNGSALDTAATEIGAAHTLAVDIASEDAVDAAMRGSLDDLGGRLDIRQSERIGLQRVLRSMMQHSQIEPLTHNLTVINSNPIPATIPYTTRSPLDKSTLQDL